MIHMVAGKLKHEKWMQEADLVEANTHVFEKMGIAVSEHYKLDYEMQMSWEATRLYLDGLE